MFKKKAWLIFQIAVGIAGIGMLALLVTNSIVRLGQNIPQQNLLLDYTIGLLWSITLGASILVWPIPNKDKPALLSLWLVKSLVTLGFMLVFEAYYSTLDSYYYFDTPRQPDFIWTGFKITDGTGNILRLVWLHNQLLPQSYHALKVSFAMTGLVAIYIFYRAVVIFLKREEISILYVLALFPSILFWTSIIGKEPMALLGIGLYTYGMIGWYRRKQSCYLWVLAVGVAIATYIRFWISPILLIPVTVILMLCRQSTFTKIILTIVVGIGIGFAINRIQNVFEIASLQDLLVSLNTLSRLWNYGGSAQVISTDFTQIDQLITFIPFGAFTALFRPLPGEVLNPFGLLAGLENLLLLFLLCLAALRTRRKDFKNPIVLWATLLVLTWATVYSFISFQNLGAAVRFKLQILPILLGLLLYLGRRRSIVPSYQSSISHK
ncbi:hypothetical protein [Allocoleopsis franciscana]|uniref:Glycosyltransferase RgtA/B/C/D-like domain-containing protein n=1 Tax=Allocoleopsis franciscana PCC 7113 TaxID=1173027 RepID=K9WMX4_9CYAN|nr:hypothetical protein [Allocoleopsis franciscana]AFZ20907.1 hypothetical protein Mic7113_5258 [Allocoleopsis franciscana PCC 7113]